MRAVRRRQIAHPVRRNAHPVRRMAHPVRRIAATALLAATALALTAPSALAAGPPMPVLTGKPLMNAFRVLDHRTHVDVHDVSGVARHVLWPANWKVCTQTPPPGTDLAGKNVTLGVVKDAETCPAP